MDYIAIIFNPLKMKNLVAYFILIITFIACSQAEEGNYKSSNAQYESDVEEMSPTEKNGFISSSAAKESSDTTRKFIRTAEMKFRVKDAYKTSMTLENVALRFEGFVTYTHLESITNRTEITPISADSSLETIYYTVKNDITIRVPNYNLDTTLRTIAHFIDYLDYRTIKAQDVSLDLLANQMAEKRISKHTERLTDAIDGKGKKLKETTSAEESLYNKEADKEKSILSSLSIKDKIDFSTIYLNIYQRQAIKRTVIENHKNIDKYEPGLFAQIGESLKTGWHVLKAIIIGLVKIWPLFLIGIVIWLVIKFAIRKKDK